MAFGAFQVVDAAGKTRIPDRSGRGPRSTGSQDVVHHAGSAGDAGVVHGFDGSELADLEVSGYGTGRLAADQYDYETTCAGLLDSNDSGQDFH